MCEYNDIKSVGTTRRGRKIVGTKRLFGGRNDLKFWSKLGTKWKRRNVLWTKRPVTLKLIKVNKGRILVSIASGSLKGGLSLAGHRSKVVSG